ncbi:MAG TPA: hypothetical protein DEO94_02040 [Cyanobacteria bacterium UBA11991]|nr:hypothetical protein [Cyanobacteriota bacterium]MDY6357993.1 hypothetical protein [Cyanobacteriota bacterium]MDY6364307.1 hypothetical protein [Cyanobacteriota bacterium]MDY6383625.1 hypothetical protein [Cyanobacteriota bacterium]HCB10932.1 hypothetical protein [Cyanobacteria bacterium UBA11991]
MKKILLTITFIFAFLFSSLTADAKPNYLHSITLEKNNNAYNIILEADSIAKLTRKVKSDNEIVLNLSGITSSETVNALYKGNTNIDNLIVENSGFNKLKIYISAPNIKSSSVIMKPAQGAAELVGEGMPVNKIVWSIVVLGILAFTVTRSVKRTKEDSKLLIKRDIKDREIALYKQYRRKLDEDISLGENKKMNKMLRKIDRKIDERLSMTMK